METLSSALQTLGNLVEWGLAVIQEWVALLTGALATGILAYWDRKYPDRKLPRAVVWSGVLLGFAGACFLSWDEQRAKAWATERPEFKVTTSRMIPTTDGATGSVLPGRHSIGFTFHNIRQTPASELTSRLIVMVRTLDTDPDINLSPNPSANDVFDQPVNLNSKELSPIGPNTKPRYLVVLLKYFDRRDRQEYRQVMYFWWAGSNERGEFPNVFHSATLPMRDLIDKYLLERLKIDAASYR